MACIFNIIWLLYDYLDVSSNSCPLIEWFELVAGPTH